MRILIDGYNLLHVALPVPARLGPETLRNLRRRFLNDLAHRLGPIDAAGTTVVFDAHKRPEKGVHSTSHKAMTVLFALEAESADEQIEQLIARHSAPKTLTVVSSDRRIRQAAARRKAKVVDSEDFWSQLGRVRRPAPEAEAAPSEGDKEATLRQGAGGAEEWLEAFGHLDRSPEVRELGRRPDYMPTDAEIARIQREVERESGEL